MYLQNHLTAQREELAVEMQNNGRNVSGMEILFRDITVKRGEREILRDVGGIAHAGQVLAVMGPSGE